MDPLNKHAQPCCGVRSPALWLKLSLIPYMSRDMTKPTKWLCAPRRLRSAWASAQSDQSLCCLHEESLGPKLPTERTAKTLIRLSGCPGWSESSLGAQSLCWFCHVAAHTVCANSEGSVEIVHMRRLAWAFTVCLCGKYPLLMSWLKYETMKSKANSCLSLWDA